MRLVAVILTLVVAATPAFGQGLPIIKAGTPYTVARQELLRQGWEPYSSPERGACDPGDERCAGRPEMESCAGTGVGSCIFLWRRNGILAVVGTMGEVRPYVSGVERRGGPPQPAEGGTWEAHPSLYWPATRLSVVGSDGGADYVSTTMSFFQEINSRGFRCDAKDTLGTREVTVSCRRAGVAPQNLTYRGNFVGAGYFFLEHLDIDGRRLGFRETARHVRQVLAGGGLT